MKALVLLVMVGVAQAAEYSDDDLCRAIGETRLAALQPRDRLFLEQRRLAVRRGQGLVAVCPVLRWHHTWDARGA